jgi:hypothetical protein
MSWKEIALIFGLTFLVYGNTFNHDFAWDDDIVYVKNKYVQKGISGIPGIVSNSYIHGFTGNNDQNYRPTPLIIHAIVKEVVGNKPKPVHFFQVLMYGLCVLLLLKLCKALFEEYPKWIPYVIALLFLAHPLHTEVVANIKSLDEICMLLFMLAALIQLVKYLRESNIKSFVWFVVFYLLALFSKEIALSFVILIPLFTYVFFKASKSDSIKIYSASIVGALAYFLVRTAILDSNTFVDDLAPLNNGLVAASSSAERFATAIYMQGLYVRKLFFPLVQSFDYSLKAIPFVSLTSIQFLLSMLVLGTAAVWGIWAVIKKKNPIAFAVLWYFGTIALVANVFVLIGSTFGERFTFTPSVGFIIAVVLGFYWLSEKVKTFAFLKNTKVIYTFFALAFIGYSAKSITRNDHWKNNETLFLRGLEECPNSTRINGAAGTIYREKAEKERNPTVRRNLYNKAIECYKQAARLLPENFDSWYNLGVCYMETQQGNKAMVSFKEADEMSVGPHSKANNNMGVLYFNKKDYKKAIYHFERALEGSPNLEDAIGNLGAAYHSMAQPEKAIIYYERALKLNPNKLGLLKNSLRAYQQLGMSDNAKQVYDKLQLLEKR